MIRTSARGEHADTVQLYCRPQCAKCQKVEAWLGELGLHVVVHDIASDDAALAEVERLGFRSMPVVVTSDGRAALGVEPDDLAAALPVLAEAAQAHGTGREGQAAGSANERWGAMLAGWAIPDELVAAAPESPYFFDPQVFIAAADASLASDSDTVSDTVAREALPPDGTVLDVGAAAGAASLRLHPARIVAVDPSGELLAALDQRATNLGIETTLLQGTWPDAAPKAPIADLVVCHHVAYNVADLAGFAAALTEHAARRVVLELTAVHPMAWMTPYWQALHGLPQPEEPTADDAVAVLAELGLDVRQQRWQRTVQMIGESGHQAERRIARRLCLPAERLPELRRVLAEIPPPKVRDVATVWWDR